MIRTASDVLDRNLNDIKNDISKLEYDIQLIKNDLNNKEILLSDKLNTIENIKKALVTLKVAGTNGVNNE
jgi:hypothetical protein